MVTAFLVESYRFLRPPENQPIVDVLNEILHQMKNPQNASSFALSPPDAASINTGSSTDPRIYNILWLIALVTSLFVALFSILMKQWLRVYLQWTEAHGQDAIRIRQMRRQDMTEWSVKDKIIVSNLLGILDLC